MGFDAIVRRHPIVKKSSCTVVKRDKPEGRALRIAASYDTSRAILDVKGVFWKDAFTRECEFLIYTTPKNGSPFRDG